MLKLALGMMTVALLLSGCTAIQNTLGGGSSSGGDTGGTGGDTGSNTSGTPIATFTGDSVQFSLFGCKRFADDVANVVCTFSGNNTRSYDYNLYIDARGDGQTRAILNDGREFATLGYKCSDCTKWWQGSGSWKFVSQITYKPLLLKFSIPVGINTIKYLDLYMGSLNRVKDVPIGN